MNGMSKLQLFFLNCKYLNKKLGIVPLMYGSLGLEYIVEKSLNADDIDILIPDVFLQEKWPEMRECLALDGYTLVDEHEHTFEKDGVYFSYAGVENLEPFAGIRMDEIKQYDEQGAFFMLLSLQQYLIVYQSSIKDGYRVNERRKKDQEKIDFILAHLSLSNEMQ